MSRFAPFLFWLCMCSALCLMGLSLAMMPNGWLGKGLMLLLTCLNLSIFAKLCRGSK